MTNAQLADLDRSSEGATLVPSRGRDFNIAHVTWLLSSAGGGIPPVALSLAEAQRLGRKKNNIRVLGVQDPCARVCAAGAREFRSYGPLALGFAPGLAMELLKMAPEIIHLHGLFTWPSHAVQIARRLGRAALVVTPHGMLEPWALTRSAWKKRIFLALVEKTNLRRAALVQALCGPEAANLRRLGVRAPIATIPNGISLDEIPETRDRTVWDQLVPAAVGRRIVLFLARVHPKKGVAHLLEAWATLRRDGALRAGEWLLVIAGPDQLGHTAEMQARAGALGIEKDVLFVGPLHGDAKRAVLAAADLFVLPSFSEGFSVAVLEALAARLPVFITRQCNFDVSSFGAGIVGEPNADSTSRALRDLIALPEAERRSWGERGRAEVDARYQWPAIARRMLDAYDWALRGGSPPDGLEVLR